MRKLDSYTPSEGGRTINGTSITLLPTAVGPVVLSGEAESKSRISGVNAVRSELTHNPEGRGVETSKAGMGIAPGRRSRREAQE